MHSSPFSVITTHDFEILSENPCNLIIGGNKLEKKEDKIYVPPLKIKNEKDIE